MMHAKRSNSHSLPACPSPAPFSRPLASQMVHRILDALEPENRDESSRLLSALHLVTKVLSSCVQRTRIRCAHLHRPTASQAGEMPSFADAGARSGYIRSVALRGWGAGGGACV